jgi:hypothetical protein
MGLDHYTNIYYPIFTHPYNTVTTTTTITITITITITLRGGCMYASGSGQQFVLVQSKAEKTAAILAMGLG